jgi:hypothetical protein
MATTTNFRISQETPSGHTDVFLQIFANLSYNFRDNNKDFTRID